MEPARGFTAFVLVTSAVVLGVTLASQYWGGLAPCELCLVERWPWGVAIVIAFVATMASRSASPVSSGWYTTSQPPRLRPSRPRCSNLSATRTFIG